MNVSLAPEVIFHLGFISITNSMLTTWVIMVILLVGAIFIKRNLKQIPGRLQAGIETFYSGIWNLTETVTGNKAVTAELFPYLLTIFFFILLSNWSGLIPGIGSFGFTEIHHGKEVFIPIFRAPTTDLNMVAIMALFSMGYVQYLGIKYAGPKAYFGQFFNVKSPLSLFIGTLEFVAIFVRLVSFTFRLFGNIFAGEVLIATMIFLVVTIVPFLGFLPLPFFFLEFFVGLLQTLVFCFLTIIFTALAIMPHTEEGEEHTTERLTKLLTKEA